MTLIPEQVDQVRGIPMARDFTLRGTVRRSVRGADLRTIPMLADLADDELAWIAARCEERIFEPGDTLFQPGIPAEEMFFVLEGAIEGRRSDRDADAPTFSMRTGDVSGLIPFSRMKTFQGRARVLMHTRLAVFPASGFSELLHRIPILEPRFVALLTDRVRETERRDHEYERVRLIGRISAGITHELNNPVAAARQAATEMRHRLDSGIALTLEVIDAGIGAEALHRLDDVRQAAAARPAPSPDPIEQSEQEEAMTARLVEAGVPEPWVVASTFVAAGITCDAVSAVIGELPATARRSAVCWLEAVVATDRLLHETTQSLTRVSDLVSAFKTYTQMDRPSVREPIDLRDGIEATLTIFGARLAEKQITVTRQLSDLPPVPVFASDINQVWANVVSNAIDAVNVGGHIAVLARREDDMVRIDIKDDGVGIPADLQERVWEPFFTTKDVGKGAGLGLDIVRRIVVRRHGGTVTLTSVPGETVFSVRLPLA